MSIISQERPSEAPYVETITHGHTVSEGSSIRPAESHWHMVFVKVKGRAHSIVTGPLTSAGVTTWGEGAEILWVKFKLGTFMPNLPARRFLDSEAMLPEATSQSFWLNGSVWQFPDFENVDTFVNRLIRNEVLIRDPLVNEVLRGHPTGLSSRTVRHRFLRATGLSHNEVFQIERAQRAAELLRQGKSILDTVDEAGYFDQPHLTRSLKQWVGYSPAQLVRLSRPEQVAILYKTANQYEIMMETYQP